MGSFVTKLSFSASGTAAGLISNGISFFLLLYYSQVLGLDPALAGLALLISLAFDAISDPLVGHWSDRLQHRLGRRHPFLLLSILPAGVCYFLLWDPPELGQLGLFVYLLTVTVLLRFALTLHTVPFNALLPEITTDYEERTRLMNYSYSSSWFFGTAMAVLMYAYWLADAPGEAPGSGILRRSGFIEAGLVAALVTGVCLAVAALGTRRVIPMLAAPPPRPESLATMFRQGAATLNDSSFFAMLGSGLMSAAAAGTSTALWAYMQPYFWGFSSDQTSLILAAQLLSSVLAFLLLPVLASGREKKPILVGLSLGSLVVGSGPVFLKLLGALPAAGSAALFSIMAVVGVLQVMLIVMTGVVSASMIADMVESRALATGRREEGLLFAVLSFTAKVASGAGVWAGGVMLSLVNFPTDTLSTAVPEETVRQLGWVYGPVLAGFYLIGILCLSYYRLDRASHEDNLRRLRFDGSIEGNS